MINQFESRTFFSPVLRLELARAYRIDTWIDPGFRELVNFPIATITLDDASRIGMITFFHLVLTKSKIEELWKGMAYNCPPVEVFTLPPLFRADSGRTPSDLTYPECQIFGSGMAGIVR